MIPAKAIGAYGLASVWIAIFARPEYNILDAFILLISGAAGSLKLCIEASQDVFFEDFTLERQFSSEALTVSLLGLVIWLLGAFLVFKAAQVNWKGGFLFSGILVWIVGSCYNIFWTGIRSL